MKTINLIFIFLLLNLSVLPVYAQDTDGIRTLEEQYKEARPILIGLKQAELIR